jgi:hypothetical protein
MFGDPGFPPPRRSIYESHQHPWIEFRGTMEHLA